jgi:uncharacterized protein (TIGR02246 family)
VALTIEDRLAIQDLYARFNHAADTGDVETYVGSYTEDAEFISPVRRARGKDEIRSFITLRSHALATAVVRDEQHWNNNLVVDGEGDHATGSIYMVGIGRDAATGDLRFNYFGRYHDTLVKEPDGRWRFRKRHFNEHMTPLGEEA